MDAATRVVSASGSTDGTPPPAWFAPVWTVSTYVRDGRPFAQIGVIQHRRGGWRATASEGIPTDLGDDHTADRAVRFARATYAHWPEPWHRPGTDV